MKRLFVLALVAACWQGACTSLTDKGDELFEKGLFLEAERTYNEALQKDADDTDALAGLQKARVKIIDVGLIEVRMLRMAKNDMAAADKLEDLLRKQALWRVQFTSGIAETQEYETEKAKEFLIAEMNREADGGFPERARWLGQSYRTILENNGASPELEAVQNKSLLAGQKRCQEFQAIPQPKDVFLRSFVSRYCSIWGSSWSARAKIDDPWLYSDVKFANDFRVEKLNYAGSLDSKGLQIAFGKVFRSSPYYHPSAGRVLDLRMSGTLQYADDRNLEKRRKSYEEEEVWEEIVKVTDANGETRDDKVKKKKKVTRHFEYFVTLHQEAASYTSQVEGTLAGRPYASQHQNSQSRSSESHNESHSMAGIYPKKPQLMDVRAWFEQQDQAAAASFKTDLDRNWGQYFCPLISEAGQGKEEKSEQWELIERCGRVEGENLIVNTYYRSRFHLSYREFWSLLEGEGKSVAATRSSFGLRS